MKEHRVWVVLGILIVLGLLGLAIGLGRPKMRGVAQFPSPLQTPTPVTIEPTPVGRNTPTPTALSEDWPTLTPPPTVTLIPRGVPVAKPTLLPTSTSTPLPPITLPPILEGNPPEELWSILYLPLDDELAVYGVQVDAQGRRWSGPQVVYDFRENDPVPNTRLTKLNVAPTGDRLAIAVAYLESYQTWLFDLTSRETSFLPACRGFFSCTVRDWSPDGRTIIIVRYQADLGPDDFLLVDVVSGMEISLPVPETMLAHTSVRKVVFSPDGRFIAWMIEGRGKDRVTEIWLTDNRGDYARLLASNNGWAGNLEWHPDNSQIAYAFAMGEQRANIQFLSVEGSGTVSLLPTSDPFANPVWSPDGYRIALTWCADVPPNSSLADQRCNISVFDFRTNLLTPIIVSPGRAYLNVSWSPDASLLAFVSASDEELQSIWLFSVETGGSYPISGYLFPFSEYIWLSYAFTGGRNGR